MSLIDKKLEIEVYENFGHSGLVLTVLEYLSKDKILEARSLMATIIDNYRELNPLDTIIYSEPDINRHNTHVNAIKNMEETYSKFMLLIEEHELLRQ